MMRDGVEHAARRDDKRKPRMRMHGKASTRIAVKMIARRGAEAREQLR